MATFRKTTATRTKAAVLKSMAELTHSIEMIDAKLKEMTARQEEFLQKSYVSQKVSHKTFGEGVIVEQTEEIIKVSFTDIGLTKAFVIHQKYMNRPTFENDAETIAVFTEFADRRQSINYLKQERNRLENQRREVSSN